MATSTVISGAGGGGLWTRNVIFCRGAVIFAAGDYQKKAGAVFFQKNVWEKDGGKRFFSVGFVV